jgi:prepilin-type N-terminal cleavage/methylation domain-containing protein
MMKKLEPCDRRSGYTLIELLEAIVAIAIGACLAETASKYFEGIGQKVVYWTIATVGSAIIFLCLLFGIGYLFHFRTRGQSKNMQKPMTRGTDTSDKTQ